MFLITWMFVSIYPKTEPQGKKLLGSAYKIEKETTEKNVFYVSIDKVCFVSIGENMRPRE